MFSGAIDKLYGIDFNRVARGGKGNPIIYEFPITTKLFANEKDMITEMAELQNDDFVKNIRPFVAVLNKQDYEFKLK